MQVPEQMALMRSLFCVAVVTGTAMVGSDPAQNIPGQNKDPRVFIDSPVSSTGLLPPCLREGRRSGSLNSPTTECTIVVRTKGTFQMCTGTSGPEGASPVVVGLLLFRPCRWLSSPRVACVACNSDY
jgi:hypothetical protein